MSVRPVPNLTIDLQKSVRLVHKLTVDFQKSVCRVMDLTIDFPKRGPCVISFRRRPDITLTFFAHLEIRATTLPKPNTPHSPHQPPRGKLIFLQVF